MSEDSHVTLYTDGACLGNPGPGGWAAILVAGPHMRELAGAEEHTTNNRMELRAAIEGLAALSKPCRVVLTTDSQYVKNGITSWIHNWKKKGWMRGKEPVKNRDLWQALDTLCAKHQVDWRWTRGHSGHPENEACDQLASAMAKRVSLGEDVEALRVDRRSRTDAVS